MLKKKTLAVAAACLASAARLNLGLTCFGALHQPAPPQALQGPQKG